MRIGMRWTIRLFAALAMVLVTAIGTSEVTYADYVFIVDNTDDDVGDNNPGDGDCRIPITVAVVRRCTLRAAIEESNAQTLPVTAVLPPTTIRVTRPLPAVTRRFGTYTDGASSTVIQAVRNPGGDTLPTVFSTAPNSGSSLTLVGVTVQGSTGGGLAALAGVRCEVGTTCRLISSVVQGNQFEGVRNRRGTFTITNTRITGNGTGIQNDFGGTINITSSNIVGNTRGVQGPAFQGAGGIVNLSGGIVNLTTSTVSGNSTGHPSNTGAGGISNQGELHLRNSTVSGNVAGAAPGAAGLLIGGGSADLIFSTVANNSGLAGIHIVPGGGGSLIVGQTIVSGNNPTNCTGFTDAITDNLSIDSGTGCGFGATSFSSTDPLLGPLASNGGPTQTHLPALNSPATDKTLCVVTGFGILSSDQRGNSRPVDGDNDGNPLCDIGSVERPIPFTFPNLPPLGIPSLSPANGTAAPDQAYTLTYRWDVPRPENWAALQSLDLRLRVDGQVVFGVRWDHVTDLFQTLDANGAPRGPLVSVGVPLILGSGPARLDLERTRSQGTGLTGTGAILTLPLLISPSLAGKTLVIEVSAIGDTGNADPFTRAGSITVAGVASAGVAPQSDDDEDDVRQLTETQRLQRSRSNQSGLDDERIEGDVLAVRCDLQPREIDIANRDGVVKLKLRRDAAGDCSHVAPGDYLEGDGEKEHEQEYWVDSMTVRKR